jgi:hypothetical protein
MRVRGRTGRDCAENSVATAGEFLLPGTVCAPATLIAAKPSSAPPIAEMMTVFMRVT